MDIADKIELLDSVLTSLGVPGVLENRIFIIDKEVSNEIYARITVQGEKSIRMSLTLSLGGVEIGIDRVDEAYGWSEKQLRLSTNDTAQVLTDLLSCRSVVEYWGRHHTRISFFDASDSCIRRIDDYSGLSLFAKRSRTDYFPVFPRASRKTD